MIQQPNKKVYIILIALMLIGLLLILIINGQKEDKKEEGNPITNIPIEEETYIKDEDFTEAHGSDDEFHYTNMMYVSSVIGASNTVILTTKLDEYFNGSKDAFIIDVDSITKTPSYLFFTLKKNNKKYYIKISFYSDNNHLINVVEITS